MITRLYVYIHNYDRHMIVHMTGLYTRLVTYARLHILILVVRIPVYIVHNFVLAINYSVMFHFSYHIVITCVVMHKHLFPLHTLIRLLLMTLDSHVQDFWTLSYIVQVFVWSQALRGVGVSLFLIIGILALLFMLFPDSIYITSRCHFFSLFICYHCVHIYMSYCSDIDLS